MTTPDILAKYRKDPSEILGPRVLPPPAKKRSDSPHSHPLRAYGKGGGKGFRPMYEDPEVMQYAIDLYFDRIKANGDPPTIADLALALGFASRQGLMDYREKGEGFADTIDAARTRIEAWKNKFLLKGGPTTQAAIFDLKNNHGWAEKSEQTTTIGAADSLTALVQALQGSVLRPVLSVKEEEVVEGEFSEETPKETLPIEAQPADVLPEPGKSSVGTYVAVWARDIALQLEANTQQTGKEAWDDLI